MTYQNFLKNKNLSQLTISTYLKHTNNFLKYVNNRKITKTLFRKYIALYDRNHSPNSTRLAYCSIMQYLKFIKCKWVNDIKKFKLPRLVEFPKPIVNINAINMYLNSLESNFFNDRLKIIVKLLITTGMRSCEIKELNKNNFYNNKILIKGKGNKYRFVFINKEISDLIRKWKYKYFLVNKNGKKISDKQLRKILKDLGEKINTPLHPHMLRRTFCTELIKKGCNLKVVQKLMGHSSISITSKYIHLSEEEMYIEYSKAF